MKASVKEMTDLEVLRILEGGTHAAVLTWAAAAAEASDHRLRQYFADLAVQCVAFQETVRALIRQMGGAV